MPCQIHFLDLIWKFAPLLHTLWPLLGGAHPTVNPPLHFSVFFHAQKWDPLGNLFWNDPIRLLTLVVFKHIFTKFRKCQIDIIYKFGYFMVIVNIDVPKSCIEMSSYKVFIHSPFFKSFRNALDLLCFSLILY